MQAEHWVTLTVALMGLFGVCFGVVYGRKKEDLTPETRAREDLADATTDTPESPGTGGASAALDLAQFAVTSARDLAGRVQKMEARFARLQSDYKAIYKWSDWVTDDWPTLRQHDKAPPRPDTVRPPE